MQRLRHPRAWLAAASIPGARRRRCCRDGCQLVVGPRPPEYSDINAPEAPVRGRYRVLRPAHARGAPARCRLRSRHGMSVLRRGNRSARSTAAEAAAARGISRRRISSVMLGPPKPVGLSCAAARLLATAPGNAAAAVARRLELASVSRRCAVRALPMCRLIWHASATGTTPRTRWLRERLEGHVTGGDDPLPNQPAAGASSRTELELARQLRFMPSRRLKRRARSRPGRQKPSSRHAAGHPARRCRPAGGRASRVGRSLHQL